MFSQGKHGFALRTSTTRQNQESPDTYESFKHKVLYLKTILYIYILHKHNTNTTFKFSEVRNMDSITQSADFLPVTFIVLLQ